MSETKFTPGPWKVWEARRYDPGTFDTCPDHATIAVSIGSSEHGSVASLQSSEHCDGGRTIDVTLADANLIAAAPDLYAACELFVKSIKYEIRKDAQRGDDEGVGLKSHTLHGLLEVLAKARGEQS